MIDRIGGPRATGRTAQADLWTADIHSRSTVAAMSGTTYNAKTEAILVKMRASLKRRGAEGIRGLGRHFKARFATRSP